MTMDTPATPPTKTLVIIRGKGTVHETRIPTTIPLYWSAVHQQWMTVPDND
jgi:hypothetical protein